MRESGRRMCASVVQYMSAKRYKCARAPPLYVTLSPHTLMTTKSNDQIKHAHIPKRKVLQKVSCLSGCAISSFNDGVTPPLLPLLKTATFTVTRCSFLLSYTGYSRLKRELKNDLCYLYSAHCCATVTGLSY